MDKCETNKVVVITKEHFNKAVSEAMMSGFFEAEFKDNPHAAMLYSLGGVIFAKKVRDILFDGVEEEENNE